MQTYLTEKAEKSPGGKIAGASVCLALAVSAISVAAESAAKRDWGGLLGDIVLLALMLWPVIGTGLHLVRRRRALALAAAFEQQKSDILSVSSVESSIPMPGAKAKIRDLIKTRYLIHVELDWEQGEILLNAPHPWPKEKDVLPIKCPNCGGPNRLVRGRVNSCTFCGTILTRDQAKP